MEDEIPSEVATALIDSSFVDENGRLGIITNHENAERVSQILKHYSGNRVSSILLLVDRVPNLLSVIENIAYFLKNYHFMLDPLPSLMITNGFGARSIPTEELVTLVDQLVEALCDNISVPHLRIITPAPPSPRLIRRLFSEKASPRSLPMGDRSGLRVGDFADEILVNASVTAASEHQNERAFAADSADTALETFIGVLMTLHGAAKLTMLLHPRSVQRLATSLSAFDVTVPQLIFGGLEGLAAMLEGASIYTAIARSKAVKSVTFHECTFVGPEVPVVDVGTPRLIDVTLVNCGIGRQAVNVFLSRPIGSLILSGRGSTSSTNLIDDFVGDLCRGQPSLCTLALLSTALDTNEVESLCNLLSNPVCHITSIAIGGEISDGAPVLTSDCISMFFKRLPEMRRLKGVQVEYSVTSQQIANAVVTGVKNNFFLRCLRGLKFEVGGLPGLPKEIEFWTQCNGQGRYLVEEHLARPKKIPIALLTKIFYQCSCSGDIHVLFYFLRQLVPSLLNSLNVRRSRRQKRWEEAE